MFALLSLASSQMVANHNQHVTQTEFLALKKQQKETFEMLTSIQQTVKTLEAQVKAVGAKTFILDSNERVRTNAVGVLYNKTLETQTVLNRLEAQTYRLNERVDFNLNETATHADTLLEVARKETETRDILDKKLVLSQEKGL